MQIDVKHLNEIPKAAAEVLKIANGLKIFLFYGEMGAGKTTFINALAKHLGTLDHTSSPTFSIVNEYKTAGDSIFHFDFYRSKNQTEALDMGYEDYFYSGSYCLVEWPEKIADLLPQHYVKVTITAINQDERTIIATVV